MNQLPQTYERLVVQTLSHSFRDAVVNEICDWQHPDVEEVCIRNRYVNIAAGDVNTTSGRNTRTGNVPPFSIGFTGIGEIVEIGHGVPTSFHVGQMAVYYTLKYNAYAEYSCVPSVTVTVVPELDPKYLSFIPFYTTIVPAFEKSCNLTRGDTVLVTAAAGATGHLAVQYAKSKCCHVVGTCSSAEKKHILKDLGCDRVINYTTENLENVLKDEYPNGINMIWETIGGNLFEICLKNLAYGGTILVIGFTSLYKNESPNMAPYMNLQHFYQHVISKAAVVTGFHGLKNAASKAYTVNDFKNALDEGILKVVLDNGKRTTGREFVGLHGIIEASEHLQAGKNIGSVIVKL